MILNATLIISGLKESGDKLIILNQELRLLGYLSPDFANTRDQNFLPNIFLFNMKIQGKFCNLLFILE